ncbi:MAG: fumarylacetoacetate hydrolase family protein [Candidatus Methanomethylophilaceae archaeon]
MNPGKIICIGWNYRPHVAELKAALPKEPMVFLKPSSCMIGDGDDIIIPEGITNVQHEVELALIFGKTGKDIQECDAMSYVSEVAVFNDVTARDMQANDRKAGNSWDLSKGMDTFGPISKPVSAKGLDLFNLHLELAVNDEIRQSGYTSHMIFTLPKLISYVSRYMTVEKGDVMATGTPDGISEICRGDIVTATIDGIGSVTNRVV